MITRRFEGAEGFALVPADHEGLDFNDFEHTLALEGRGVVVRSPWPIDFTVELEGPPTKDWDLVAHVAVDFGPVTRLALTGLDGSSNETRYELTIEPHTLSSVLVCVDVSTATYRLWLFSPENSPSFPSRRHLGAVHIPPWSPQFPGPGVRTAKRLTRTPPAPPHPRPADSEPISSQSVTVDTQCGWVALFHPDRIWEFPDRPKLWFETPGQCSDSIAEGRVMVWGPGVPADVFIVVHIRSKPAGGTLKWCCWYRSVGSIRLAPASHLTEPDAILYAPRIRLPAGDWQIGLFQFDGDARHHLVCVPAPKWTPPDSHPDEKKGLPFRFVTKGALPPAPPEVPKAPKSFTIRFGGNHHLRIDQDGLALDGHVLPVGGDKLEWIAGPPPMLRIRVGEDVWETSLPPRPSVVRYLEGYIRLFRP